MNLFKVTTVVFIAACMMAIPAVASADAPICHDGILSDDAGQGCADGLYQQVYGGGGSSNYAICHDGILSDDVGHGCANSSSSSSYSAPAATSSSGYSGGSSNSMVNPYCESSGNSQARSPDGKYWGKYQFDYATWVANGGAPSAYGNASAAYQDQVASRVTYDAWPNC